MSAPPVEEEEEAPPPPPELTDAEKVEELKRGLAAGEMGPAKFHSEFQEAWMRMKEQENPDVPQLRRTNTRSTADMY